MSNPWDGTPSIWDGWTGQCFGEYTDNDRKTNTDLYCAAGYVNRFDPAQVGESEIIRRCRAVGDWLRGHGYKSIAAANDSGRWTPEQFRDLDRRLEWKYQQQRQLELAGAV